MYTQCPHCLTLFRISGKELKPAAGKVRCCQCNQVFNALDSLQEEPLNEQIPVSTETTDEPDPVYHFEEQVTEDPLFTDTLNLESEQLVELMEEEQAKPRKIPDDIEELFTIQDDGLETEPDYLAGGSESQMSELLDKDSSSLMINSPSSKSDAKVVSFNTTEETLEPQRAAHEITLEGEKQTAADLEPSSDATASASEPFTFVERHKNLAGPTNEKAHTTNLQLDDLFEPQPASLKTIAWGAGSLLLGLLVLLQLSWLNRDLVIQYPEGQKFLTAMCSLVGCTVPQQRDLSQIAIEHRNLTGHPSKPNALLLQLGIVNRAEFPQPLPKLRLSLFNNMEKLVAERVFTPAEYLPKQAPSKPLMQPSTPMLISLELVDPGKDVTGFKFEFL